MSEFYWIFDTQNYLPNKNKHACKMPLKKFVNHIAKQLDDYKGMAWSSVRDLPNHHSCMKLSRLKSKEAKRLHAHLEEINARAGDVEGVILEPFQIPIKGFESKQEYRIFGYIKSNVFYLVYLDPDHAVWSQK